MKNRIYYTSLYDYYASLLTDVQRKYFKEYYFNNLSLSEIADNFNVSKNAISKTLKEVIAKLDYYERELKLLKNKGLIEKVIKDKEILEKIEDYI